MNAASMPMRLTPTIRMIAPRIPKRNSFGPTGFEPAISCPPDRRDNQASLRPDLYFMMFCAIVLLPLVSHWKNQSNFFTLWVVPRVISASA